MQLIIPFNYDDRLNSTGLRDALAGKQSADRILIGRCQTVGFSTKTSWTNRAGTLSRCCFSTRFCTSRAARFDILLQLEDPKETFRKFVSLAPEVSIFADRSRLTKPSLPLILWHFLRIATNTVDERNVLQIKCKLTRVVGEMFHLSKSSVFPLNVFPIKLILWRFKRSSVIYKSSFYSHPSCSFK